MRYLAPIKTGKFPVSPPFTLSNPILDDYIWMERANIGSAVDIKQRKYFISALTGFKAPWCFPEEERQAAEMCELNQNVADELHSQVNSSFGVRRTSTSGAFPRNGDLSPMWAAESGRNFA